MEDKRRNAQKRRQPGANAKRPPQKAPHARPRKNPAPPQEPERKAPEVVYLAPKPFSRNRLILHLATIVAVVIAVLLGLSIFFKVEKIEVSGCSQYTAWEVQQASGIQVGDQLLTFSVPRASAKIINALPYVKTVRIGVSLPDTVKIEIVETRVTYALQDQGGIWWLIDSDGKILEQCPAGKEKEHTVISGVTLDAPAVSGQAVAFEPEPDAMVSAAQRLEAVINIAGTLEKYGIIGEADSIDVSNTFEIERWYDKKFQVQLGDTSRMDEKIRILKGTIAGYEKNNPSEKGVLDLSDPDWVEYDSGLDKEE